MGRRVLVTGADTFWGGRVIQALENDPSFEVILGLGEHDPSVPFERAEFVRADQTYSILHRLVRATRVDTIVHTFLVSDSSTVSSRALHEINVIGTMNLLAAAGAPGSTVTTVVVKSSTKIYGSSPRDPYTFTEESTRSGPATTMVERSILEAEALIADFAEDNPNRSVATLRFANVLGGGLTTPITRNLSRAFCPVLIGFDPLLQFVEANDVVRALEHATRNELNGVYNVAGAGRLPWSEIISIAGSRPMPMPSVHHRLLMRPLSAAGIYELPGELADLLRFGRGVDSSKISQTGFAFRFTSAGAVEAFAQQARLESSTGRPPSSYRYEHDVEQFFRHSPAVVERG
ncbi:MAG: NAD-dependent epimerase/dehydratase family protein [Actinomycetes bacterium]